MTIQHVKRLQMAFDFRKTPLPPPELPEGFRYVPWNPSLLEVHAEVKHRGFRDDFDAKIFPTFRDYERCRSLMDAISSSSSFLPEATLLIARDSENRPEYVANIQGMRHSEEVGAIQNVAVLPDYRNRKLGRALLIASLHGFRRSGVQRVTLEVTADNLPATKLYHGVGFTTYRVHFREIFQ